MDNTKTVTIKCVENNYYSLPNEAKALSEHIAVLDRELAKLKPTYKSLATRRQDALNQLIKMVKPEDDEDEKDASA